MSRPLAILRPEPGCGETLAAAQATGLEAFAAPLFAIEPVRWQSVDASDFDGIIAGSANAFRLGGDALHGMGALSVHAVGARTADAARDAGFAIATVGQGGLQALLDTLPPLRLLRLAGEARVPLQLPAGMTMDERVVYRAEPLPLDPGPFARPSVALLHSGEAARRFAGECDRLGIDRGRIAIAALAPRIADEAGQGWRSVSVSPSVDDSALLALGAQLCQD